MKLKRKFKEESDRGQMHFPDAAATDGEFSITEDDDEQFGEIVSD